jgi:mannose-6-phosphate isomerase-like protein (cupin superfamily)
MTANVSITDNERGTWSYAAGVNGTVVVGAGKRVIGLTAYSAAGGTLTINAGDSVVIPAGSSISISPKGNITAPTIVFSAGVTSYFIETVS